MSYLPAPNQLAVRGPAAIERRTAREITRARTHGAAVAAREAAKLEAIAEVTEVALMATSHISAVEALLIERTPHAEARLRHIADAGCTGMPNVVLGLGHRF